MQVILPLPPPSTPDPRRGPLGSRDNGRGRERGGRHRIIKNAIENNQDKRRGDGGGG